MPGNVDVGIRIGGGSLQIARCLGSRIELGRHAGMSYLPAGVTITQSGQVLPFDPAGAAPPLGFIPEATRLLARPTLLRVPGAPRAFGAEELVAALLGHLVGLLRGQPVRALVAALPPWMSTAQREALGRAVASAGLHLAGTVESAVAAVTGAYFPAAPTPGHRLVFQLGSTSFAAAVVETAAGSPGARGAAGGETRVLTQTVEETLGSHALDRDIAEYVAMWEVRRKHPTMASFTADREEYGDAFRRLRAAAQQARAQLVRGRAGQAEIEAPDLTTLPDGRPVSVRYQLSRTEVEQMMAPAVDQTLRVCRETLAHAGVPAAALREVVFTGNGSLWPSLRQRVLAGLGAPAAWDAAPQTVVVQGAAVLAALTPLPAAASGALRGAGERATGPARPPAFLVSDHHPQHELGELTRIGRARDSDVVLSDAGVSRDHAEIAWDAGSGAYALRQLSQRSPTLLRGEPLARCQVRLLADGDELSVAGHAFRIHIQQTGG